jgi:hypothetical protein
MLSLMSTTDWEHLRRLASGRAFVLLTYVVPGALVVVMLASGVLSPWLRISDPVFRSLVLLSLCSILTFLLIERRALETLVREDEHGRVRGAFFEVDFLRLAVINTLAVENPELPEDRVLLVTMLPGHAAEKKGLFAYNRSDTASHADVQQKIRDKIVAEPNWTVRQIINITSLDELESFRSFMDSVEAAPAYEVKAYSTQQSLAVAAPLVIANRHAFLGTEDSTAYRLKSAIHIEGRRYAFWATLYFNDLWDDAPFTLRTRRGANQQGLEDLMRELERKSDCQPSPSPQS